MTKTFTASVKAWSEKAKRNTRLIVMEASESVYNAMTTRQPGVKETGGTFEIGKVPVDLGFLANSVQVEVGGAITGKRRNVRGLCGQHVHDQADLRREQGWPRSGEGGVKWILRNLTWGFRPL